MKPRELLLSSIFLACCLGAGCSADGGGSEDPRKLGGGSSSPAPEVAPPVTETGGMDGAGSVGVGVSLDEGVFMQGLWQDQRFSYLVVNERPETVELTVREHNCSEYVCNSSQQPPLASWQVPANSVRRFDAQGLVGSPYPQTVELADQVLGMVAAPREPTIASVLPIVSNSFNIDGLVNGAGSQLETSTVAVPEPSFTLNLVLPTPGQLLLRAHEAPTVIDWLDVVAVRSQQVTVQRVGDDFVLDIPSSASDAEPVRVEVDVAVPSSAEGRLLVGFSASLVYPSRVGGTGRLTRIFPLDEFPSAD